jgi:alpha-galactosidase
VSLSVSPKQRPRPAWYDGGVVMSGRLLDEVGLVAPLLEVDDLVIVHLVAEAGESAQEATGSASSDV